MPHYATPNTTPNAADAGGRTATLFDKGINVEIGTDASVYITPRSIPENQTLLKAYSAAGRNGGLVKFRVGDIDTLPGLLGIAN